MKFSAHLGYMWPDAPLLDRIFLAAEAGFDGVDIPSPYELPVKDLQRALLASGLTLVSIAAPPPNYTGGTPGYLGHPGAEQRFQNDIRRAMRYADALGVRYIHLLAGPVQDRPGGNARKTVQRNLEVAVSSGSKSGSKQTFLVGAAQFTSLPDPFDVAVLVADADTPVLRLRVDLHESLQSAGAEAETVADLLRTAALVAVADGPGRVPPGRGSLPLDAMFASLRDARYDNWISAAYATEAKDGAAHDWRARLRAAG